jgi:hypothetical protein
VKKLTNFQQNIPKQFEWFKVHYVTLIPTLRVNWRSRPSPIFVGTEPLPPVPIRGVWTDDCGDQADPSRIDSMRRWQRWKALPPLSPKPEICNIFFLFVKHTPMLMPPPCYARRASPMVWLPFPSVQWDMSSRSKPFPKQGPISHKPSWSAS